jgi:hypothetical protein
VLQPFDAEKMTAREVSTRVNNSAYDARDVLEAPPDQPTLGF